MNVWSWTSFFSRGVGASDHGARVFVHFFPAANNVTAPHPVQAFIEVFAEGQVVAQQGFEGLRLNQPDGLDLSDVFPELFDRSAAVAASQKLFGITVQLGTPQPRLDLSRSRVMVELCYPSHRLRYHAVLAGQNSGTAAREFALSDESAIFAYDGYETQLVEVNPEPANSGEAASPVPVPSGLSPNAQSVRGHSVRVIDIDTRHSPASAGSVGMNGFESAGRLPRASKEEDGPSQEESDATVRFLVRYESASVLPVSVRCL